MEINKGDIIVCKTGYYGNPDIDHLPKEEPLYGGAGYVDGLMCKSTSDFRFSREHELSVCSDFNPNYGVFRRAIRLATEEETRAYSLGIRNKKDITTDVMEIKMREFKKNDVCVCLPGFNRDEESGGAGYVEGKMYKLDYTSGTNNLKIHWPKDDGSGIYERSVRLASNGEKTAFDMGIKNTKEIAHGIDTETSIFMQENDAMYIAGDVCVCLPGFHTNGGIDDGGAGYAEGKIIKIKYSTLNKKNKKLNVHWPIENSSIGVFEKAIRPATGTEIHAYNNGERNIKLSANIGMSFNISYIDLDGEIKKTLVEAASQTEAVASIKNLKSINYVMSA